MHMHIFLEKFRSSNFSRKKMLSFLDNILKYIHQTFLFRKEQITNLPFKKDVWGFPRGAVVENLPAKAGDMGSSPGLGRSHMPRSN